MCLTKDDLLVYSWVTLIFTPMEAKDLSLDAKVKIR